MSYHYMTLTKSQIQRFRELSFKEGNGQELSYYEKQEITNLCKFLNNEVFA